MGWPVGPLLIRTLGASFVSTQNAQVKKKKKTTQENEATQKHDAAAHRLARQVKPISV